MADLKPFRFWCQKVLPLVYDDSLSYYELLCKVVKYLNDTITDVNELKSLVQNFLDSGIVQEDINAKLDEMAEDGTLASLINEEIFGELNSQLADLTDRVDHLDERTFVIFADSYGLIDTDYGVTQSFVDLAQSYLGIPNDRWLTDVHTGLGFAGGAGSWKDSVPTFAATLTEAQRNAVSDVIFIGGRNDAYRYTNNSVSLSDIGSNITATASACKTAFPNAKMHNAFVGMDWGADYIKGQYEVYRLYNSAQNHGMDYYSGIENVLHYRALLRSDGVHPNNTGMYALAIALVQCILNGNVDVVYEFGLATISNQLGERSSGDPIRIYESLINGMVTVNMIGDTVQNVGVASYTCNGSESNALKIADLSGSIKARFRAKNSGFSMHVHVDVTLYADNKWYTVPGDVIFADSSVYLALKQIDPEENDFLDLTSISSIQLPYVQFSCPAILC